MELRLGLGIWEWREKDGGDGPLRLHVAFGLHSWKDFSKGSPKRVVVLDIAAVRASNNAFLLQPVPSGRACGALCVGEHYEMVMTVFQLQCLGPWLCPTTRTVRVLFGV